MINLNIDKAYNLYSVITEDKYRYNNDITEYNKIVSIMDQMLNSIKAINTIPYKTNEFELVAWINYVDLFFETFKKLSEIYQFSLIQQNCYFTKYHNLPDKNDNDYLRFIRAIILPHALSLDNNEQKKFINKNKTARCPNLCWAGNDEFIIKYFIDDIDEQENYIRIKIEDVEAYVLDLYKNVDYIIPTITASKKAQKKKSMSSVNNETYDKSWNIKKKIDVLTDLVKKYGTLEDKKGISSLMSSLKTAKDIEEFEFNKANSLIIEDYKNYLSKGLDNLCDYIKGKSDNYDKLYEITVPFYNHNEDYTEFDDCGYEITKIACNYKSFDDFIERCYFSDWLKKLEPHLNKYVKLSKEMSMKEICLLTIICFSLFKIKQSDLKELFGEDNEI